MDRFFLGRREDTAVEPILEALHSLLENHQILKSKVIDLKSLTSTMVKSERAMAMEFLL